MPVSRIKLSIFINYFLFAVLLNSVGTVILQVQRYFKVAESSAAVLEACKDISIAAASFLVASFIVRIGYKKSMLAALAFMSIACFCMPFLKTFLAVKLLFVVTGVCFGLIKVSVFGTIGLIAKDEKSHISIMNFIESFFMIGILSGNFIFSGYIDDSNAASDNWFNVYYVLGMLSASAFLLLLTAPLDESAARQHTKSDNIGKDFANMFLLFLLPVVLSFIVCAFVYVLLEQSIMSWLPTFNNKVLGIPASMSIQMASILAASTAAGRFVAAVLIKKISWFTLLCGCLVGAAGLVLIALPLASGAGIKIINGWADVPVAAYVFPLIGFFLAPVYPAINSIILSSLPKTKHGMMSGLIVVFSALGGTLGSLVTGSIFQEYGGQVAFYFSLVPLAILLAALAVFRAQKNRVVLSEIVDAGMAPVKEMANMH
ncbi:MFS transporter [Foetidibacter luteolus]|uniref:MFS transporter n=1 Tax=Foetidibacter luteolus TaxID=2608880 RepID=UPI00129A4656|nr:MFS transporter [Foetidibacter luteolus]